MTAVTIRGTFKKDSRPSNGLEEIADDLRVNKDALHYVVGVVKWAGGNLAEDGSLTPAVKFLAIEPLVGTNAESAMDILDRARKARQLGRFEDEHPKQMEFEFDGDGHPTGEVRMTGDGEREVPPPSAAEILAEREEAKASVPAAQFSGVAK